MERDEAAFEAALAANLSKPLDESVTLHRAALADLHRLVETASVDIIITHPPHGPESLPLLTDLAAFAAHALQPTGALVIISGMERLPETLERLKHPDLHWVAEFDYRDNATTNRSGPPHRTMLRRKPLLVYGKPAFRLPPGDDVIDLPPAEEGCSGASDMAAEQRRAGFDCPALCPPRAGDLRPVDAGPGQRRPGRP